MSNFMSWSHRFLADEIGATAVEYAVLLALILVAVIAAITSVGNSTSGLWSGDISTISTAVGS
jgi:pilus assembly protein Flp/PilA